jgi:predicted transcriptional regulator
MSTAELKLDLIHKIDLLQDGHLNELNALVAQMISYNDQEVPKAHLKGIAEGLSDLALNKVVPHKNVIDSIKLKIANAR